MLRHESMIDRLRLLSYTENMFNRSRTIADDEGDDCEIPEQVKEVGDEEGEGGEDVEDEGGARGERKLGRR